MCACNQDGEDPFALWQQYSHPDGAFRFNYMAPPFHIAANSTDTHPVMVVDEYAAPSDGQLAARIVVEAWVTEQTLGVINAERKAFWEASGYRVLQNLRYVNYFGDTGGVLLQVEWEDHWANEVFYPYGEGCVVLSAWTDERGSRDDILLLISSFRPGHGGIE